MKYRSIFLICIFLLGAFGTQAQPDGYSFDRRIGTPIINSKASKIKIAANQLLYLMAGTVVQKTTLTGVVLKEWGGYGSGNGKFTSLKDIATDENSNIYLLDNNLIQKFDANGTFIKQWNTSSSAKGIYINSGSIYIMESGNFIKYSTEGDLLANFPVNFKSSPSYFCVDKNENFYVSQTYEVTKYNSSGTAVKDFGYWTFSGPGEIDIDVNDNLYVEDNFDDKINVYTQTSINYSRTIGANGYGPAYFQNIASFTFDASNNIFVNDNSNTNSGIQKFTSTGSFSRLFSYLDFQGNGYLYGPTHVAIDSESNIYVSDLNYLIQKFSPTGKFLKQWGGKGNTDITFGSIGSITIDPNDRIVVADAVNNVIKQFDKNGNFISKYNGYNPGKVGIFNSMLFMDVDKFGYHYIMNYGTILKYNNQGTYSKLWGGIGYDDGEFSTPIKKLTVSDSGYVYVLDRYYINKFDTSGTFISIGNYAPGLSTIATLDSNQILALDTDGNLIKYGEDGSFIKSWKTVTGIGNGEFLSIYEIKKDKSGKLYFVDISNNTVQVFSTQSVMATLNQSKGSRQLTVYPNPSRGSFKVEFDKPIITTKVINAMGEVESFHSNEIQTTFKGLLLLESETQDKRIFRSKIIVE